MIELADRIIGIEIKASSRPSPNDAGHLLAFREEYGDSVAGCLLLHGGTETCRLSEGVVATPWSRVL